MTLMGCLSSGPSISRIGSVGMKPQSAPSLLVMRITFFSCVLPRIWAANFIIRSWGNVGSGLSMEVMLYMRWNRFSPKTPLYRSIALLSSSADRDGSPSSTTAAGGSSLPTGRVPFRSGTTGTTGTFGTTGTDGTDGCCMGCLGCDGGGGGGGSGAVAPPGKGDGGPTGTRSADPCGCVCAGRAGCCLGGCTGAGPGELNSSSLCCVLALGRTKATGGGGPGGGGG
mmetsp:Transcript_15193/g.43508  ORF Transcript_15193/g.43508 Transcript_15193/m.43508 type:complete len:226 (+) Transcript_15193:993-1670(+)